MPAVVPPPIWLLDVDGVLNAASTKPPTYAWPAEAWRTVKVSGLRILVADPVLNFLRRIDTLGLAEIRWHTTWQTDAHVLAEALDLPEWSIADAPEHLRIGEHLRRNEWWKTPAVWRALLESRPVLWTDDDADTDLTREQKTTLAAAGALVVSPDPRTGLCQRHLRQIENWLHDHAPKGLLHD